LTIITLCDLCTPPPQLQHLSQLFRTVQPPLWLTSVTTTACIDWHDTHSHSLTHLHCCSASRAAGLGQRTACLSTSLLPPTPYLVPSSRCSFGFTVEVGGDACINPSSDPNCAHTHAMQRSHNARPLLSPTHALIVCTDCTSTVCTNPCADCLHRLHIYCVHQPMR
jgi:hypothetical protein